MACGNTVAYPSRAAPGRPSLHQWYCGMPRRGIAGAVCTICATFSSSVNRETKSLTRCSIGNAGLRNGALAKSLADAEAAVADGEFVLESCAKLRAEKMITANR